MEITDQYLTFVMNAEKYAIGVGNVREVLEVPRITRIPRMPPFMRGVFNLRGSVVPVLDLRMKFGMGETAVTPSTAIIVVELPVEDGEALLCVGIFADEVHKVLSIEGGSIEPPPKIGMAIQTDFIQGMGHVDDGFVVILNVRELLTAEDIGLMELEASADGSMKAETAGSPQ